MDTKTADLPQVIPVFPLDGAVLLPGGELPLRIFEPRYLNMIDDAMAADKMIGMVQTAGGEKSRPHLAQVGCAGKITSFNEASDGTYLITLTGICRFALDGELAVRTPYRQVRAAFSPYAVDLSDEDGGVVFEDSRLARALKRYLQRQNLAIDWQGAACAPLDSLVNSLAMGLPFSPAEKQALLEAATLADRTEILTTLLEIDARNRDSDSPPSLQ
ncbi:MAG: peptidase S16 [Phenylobacterium zucineum]|nr:MAG: peptidase S16 [Phenylobacterium zucineum]